MEVSIIQMILVVLFSCFFIWDYVNPSIFVCCQKVICGYAVGLILGDPLVGLQIGGTLELMSLGVVAFGGSSVPEYPLGAILGTIVAIMAGKGAEYGLMVALPISLIAIQADVMVRTANIFFVRQAQKAAEKLQMKKCYTWLWNAYTLSFLKYALPVIALFIIGPERMTAFTNAIPEWLIGGFRVAGGLLPVVGIAILMRFMNAKNDLAYLLFGFALVSFLNVPMIGIAIFGVGLGLLEYKRENEKMAYQTNNDHAVLQVGGDEDEL